MIEKNYYNQFMERAIKLARNGMSIIDTVPIFGYVIVHNNIIFVENWQRIDDYEIKYFNKQIVNNFVVLSESTIYLTLEPYVNKDKMSFINFILKYKIPKVIVGIRNPYNSINGLGIKLLKISGVEVIENILKEKCYEINKKLFTFYQKKRPFIILKWTQSVNGIICCNNIRKKNTLHQKSYQQLTEKWRTEETAFLIDSKSLISNNVLFRFKYWYGKTPIIIILDQKLIIPQYYYIYNKNYKFLIFTEKNQLFNKKNIFLFKVKFNSTLFNKIFDILYKKSIHSIIIETSQVLIQELIKKNFWDEAKIFIINIYLNSGIIAPKIQGNILSNNSFINEKIILMKSFY